MLVAAGCVLVGVGAVYLFHRHEKEGGREGVPVAGPLLEVIVQQVIDMVAGETGTTGQEDTATDKDPTPNAEQAKKDLGSQEKKEKKRGSRRSKRKGSKRSGREGKTKEEEPRETRGTTEGIAQEPPPATEQGEGREKETAERKKKKGKGGSKRKHRDKTPTTPTPSGQDGETKEETGGTQDTQDRDISEPKDGNFEGMSIPQGSQPPETRPTWDTPQVSEITIDRTQMEILAPPQPDQLSPAEKVSPHLEPEPEQEQPHPTPGEGAMPADTTPEEGAGASKGKEKKTGSKRRSRKEGKQPGRKKKSSKRGSKPKNRETKVSLPQGGDLHAQEPFVPPTSTTPADLPSWATPRTSEIKLAPSDLPSWETPRPSATEVEDKTQAAQETQEDVVGVTPDTGAAEHQPGTEGDEAGQSPSAPAAEGKAKQSKKRSSKRKGHGKTGSGRGKRGKKKTSSKHKTTT